MRITRLWMGGLAILGLAGCGGGGTPQANLTLQVVDGANEGYVVASQVGNAAWTQVRVDFGTKSISIALGNSDRYGVAVRCLGNNQVYLIQATRSEVEGPKVVCSQTPFIPSSLNPPFTFRVDWSSAASSGDFLLVGNRYGTAFASASSNPQDLPLNSGRTGSQEFLARVLGASGPKAAQIVRGVNVQPGGSLDITLSSPLPPGNVTVNGVPPSWSSGSSVLFLSGGGDVVFTLNLPSNQYRPVSGFSQAAGDRYIAQVSASQSSRFLAGFKGATGGDISLNLPAPWSNPVTITATAHPQVTGLNYAASDLKGYIIQLQGPGLTYWVVLSAGWLSGTSYQVPDLSAQLGYAPYGQGQTVLLQVGAGVSANTAEEVLNFALGANLAGLTAQSEVYGAGVQGSYQVGGANLSLP